MSKTRKIEEIADYLEEALDRVWLERTKILFRNGSYDNLPEDTLNDVNKSVIETCEKYNIDQHELMNEEDYGYWKGVLAALRWVLGDEKDNTDS